MSPPDRIPLTYTSQLHINSSTPMGAELIEGGATFRVWAPAALELYVITEDLDASRQPGWAPRAADRLVRRDDGTWAGFVPGVTDGTPYRFYVVGDGSSGFKRDPWARELGIEPPFPDCDCLVRDPNTYPWHDAGFRPPAFRELIIYQLHVGAFHGVDGQGRDKRESVAKFLDVAARIPYLRDLGVTAVQLLPIQEYPYDNSLGYNNVDFFSPEMAYQVVDGGELDRYLGLVNTLLAEQEIGPLTAAQLSPGPNQLKALVDLLHLNGIAVIFDLVYNHAGGGFDDQSLYFYDRRKNGDNNNSLYFTDKGWAGGLVFAYWNESVRDFLIRNAQYFLTEFHVDGARYDEVSVIDNHGGWSFCQDLTNASRFVKPEAIQIAEYWNPSRELAVKPPPVGMGFDAALADGLRDALRGALSQASGGRDAYVNLGPVRDHLYPPYGFGDAWRAVNCIENHDVVYADRKPEEWQPRVALLADPSNSRSWYARSRARFATSILLTAPGIPMLFMGQEVLEDKNWSDNPGFFDNTLIWWDGLEHNHAMRDFLAFTKALIRLRRGHRAFSCPAVNAFHVNNGSRVIAFHRWVEGSGEDVVIAGTLSESSLYNYEIEFPGAGWWREVFNSDAFESSAGHHTSGNAGAVFANGPPMHGFSASARITIPASGVVVFAR
jgi:1,4-alpha-glucan branching enzyme